MTSRMRVGLIGCGGQGRYLAWAVLRTDRADLVACADVNRPAAEAIARECGATDAFGNTDEMLARAQLDAVMIATTHDQLQPIALTSAMAGKHLFVEKPMALDAGQAHKLVSAADGAGVKLMVGYALGYTPARRVMKELLDNAVVGELAHVNAGKFGGRLGRWLAEPARGGGPLLFVGSHVTDQVLWLVGRPVERVYAEMRWKAGGTEDYALFTLRFAGELPAQIVCTETAHERFDFVEIVGSKDRIHAEWDYNVLYVQSAAMPAYRFPTTMRVPVDSFPPRGVSAAETRINGDAYLAMYVDELHEFLSAIEEDRPPAIPGTDALRTLEVLDAVVESGRTGRPVNVETRAQEAIRR
jgi:predicted dehydrogenase